MKNRVFILVAMIVATLSLSSCAKVKWVPTHELKVDYDVLSLPAPVATDGGSYYTAYFPIWTIGSWAAELTIPEEAGTWIGLSVENDKPAGATASGVGSVKNYVTYMPIYFMTNGAQEARTATLRVYRTDKDLECITVIKQLGR